MKFTKSLRVIGAFLLAALFAVFTAAVPARAAEPAGSLTLRCTVKKGGKTVPLAGDTYALVRIADARVTGGGAIVYTVRPEYKAFDCDFSSLPTSRLRAKARVLWEEARKHPEDWTTGVTDREGTARFEGLVPGLYLVTRTAAAPKNSRYVSEPFLTSVPEIVEGSVLYDVVSAPKFGWEEKPVPTTQPKPPSPALAQTGQLWWPVPLLTLIGLELIAIDLYRDRKKSGRLSRDV